MLSILHTEQVVCKVHTAYITVVYIAYAVSAATVYDMCTICILFG